MGAMFWMMNRNRAPRAEQNDTTDGERARAEELASLQSEVARLREQTRVNDATGPGNR